MARRARVDAAVLAVPPSASAATVVLAGRFSFERGNRARSVVVHTLACALFGIVHLGAITPFRVLIANEPMTWERLTHAFLVAIRLLLYLDVLTYWAIVGMYLALHYSNLRTSLAEARLAALRAQLNPHFLFNTLNAISTLALKGDQPAVTETIGRLSGLLRAALDEHTEGDLAHARDGISRGLRRDSTHTGLPIACVSTHSSRTTHSTAWSRR